MARTYAWRSALLAALVGIAGCGSEELTTPGQCPFLCPSGNVQLADTLLVSPDTADTSARGFVTAREAAFLLAADLDSLKSLVLMRFAPMPSKWYPTAGDTVGIKAAMPPDSIFLTLHIGQRDTAVKNLRVVVYRLPAQFDTTLTYAQALSYFADSLLVDTVAVPDTQNNSALTARMPTTLVAPPADSSVISLGMKIVADAPTAIGIASGVRSSSPLLTYYVHGEAPNDTLKRALTVSPQVPGEGTFASFVQSPDPAQIPPGVLAAGGIPSARSTVYLALPKVVVDSNSIVRATLILNLVQPIVGFARDSFYVEARPLLRDFGLKSVLYPDSSFAGHTLVHEGQSGTVEVDIASILRLWGTTSGDSLPRVLVLRVYGEGSVLGQANFDGRAAGVGSGAPQLRVTYVKKYEFGVP